MSPERRLAPPNLREIEREVNDAINRPGGVGSANDGTVGVVNNDVPTDPVRLRATQIEHADAAVASATAKIAKQEAFVASFTGDKKKRQTEHLKAAKEALAQAIAARKELD